jgi:NAD(P)-dependent dehydrogenase (short-subunit alcohol dehydrogenase family)
MAFDIPKVDLTGQIAIVTGGGRGLGRVMAQELAAAGAAVAVVGRSQLHLDETVSELEKAGARALAVAADVTDRLAVERMVQQVEQQLGALDVLVNNAGISGTIGPVWKADPDAWWQVMEINVRGAFLCARAVLPGMIARKRGRIINVASGAAVRPIAYITA